MIASLTALSLCFVHRIFIGSGWALHSVGEVFTGDRMTCQLDMDSRKVSFYLNDKQVLK